MRGTCPGDRGADVPRREAERDGEIVAKIALPLAAQTGVAKYAGEFMATGFGGRALALGGAYAAVAGDVTAAYWNPAGLMQMQYPELGLMYEQRYGLLTYNYGGVAWPFGPKYTLALSVTRLGVDGHATHRSSSASRSTMVEILTSCYVVGNVACFKPSFPRADTWADARLDEPLPTPGKPRLHGSSSPGRSMSTIFHSSPVRFITNLRTLPSPSNESFRIAWSLDFTFLSTM